VTEAQFAVIDLVILPSDLHFSTSLGKKQSKTVVSGVHDDSEIP